MASISSQKSWIAPKRWIAQLVATFLSKQDYANQSQNVSRVNTLILIENNAWIFLVVQAVLDLLCKSENAWNIQNA